MPGTVVVGIQWGDEGKAKTIDLLSSQADLVVRYQGGHNAGHTVVVDGQRFAFRLTPSGILFPHVTPVIGNGVVVDPTTLLAELDMLSGRGVDVSRLVLGANAHLIMPWHPILDVLAEKERGDAAIGTTKNGIGPAYVDKVAREGLRVQDLLAPARFRERLATALAAKNRILTKIYDHEPLVLADIEEQYLGDFAKRLGPYIGDSVNVIHHALQAGKTPYLEPSSLIDPWGHEYQYLAEGTTVVGLPERTPVFPRLDLRVEKRWTFQKERFISVVLEGQNVTLTKEILDYSCEDGVCKPNSFGPVSIGSLGVEGGF